MISFVLRRLLLAVPMLWAVLTITFIVIRVAPGDIAFVMLGEFATPEAIESLRERLGLNQPLWRQYADFLIKFGQGDLGVSLKNSSPIAAQIARVAPYTIDLTLAAMCVALLIGIPLGVVAAIYRGRWPDDVVRIFSLVGVSTPAFFLGVLLMLLFGVVLRAFPIIGGGDLSDLGSRLSHLALPALSLGLVEASLLTRITRSAMLDVIQLDYVRTARAKGVRPLRVFVLHAFRTALLPVVTVAGLFAGALLGGAVLTETVFSRPGLGKFLLDSIQSRDYPALEAGILVFAVSVVAVNLLVDALYAVIDPRIRY